MTFFDRLRYEKPAPLANIYADHARDTYTENLDIDYSASKSRTPTPPTSDRRSDTPGPQIGYARSTTARELGRIAETAFVGMNEAAIAVLPEDTATEIYTTSLAGCTGIAGCAHTPEGIVAGVSHFDPIVDDLQRERGGSPSEQFLYQYVHDARKKGAEQIDLAVTYNQSATANPRYGDHKDSYEEWFFLDQLETAAKYLSEDVRVTFVPYNSANGHTLGVNGQTQEITFDGQPIDRP